MYVYMLGIFQDPMKLIRIVNVTASFIMPDQANVSLMKDGG